MLQTIKSALIAQLLRPSSSTSVTTAVTTTDSAAAAADNTAERVAAGALHATIARIWRSARSEAAQDCADYAAVAGAAAATPPAALALAQEPDDDGTAATESSLVAAAAAAAEERDRALYEQSDGDAAADLLQLSQARLLRVLQYYRDLQESTQRAATHLEASLLHVSYAGASPVPVLEGDTSSTRRPSSRHIERRPTLLLEGSTDSVQQQQQQRRKGSASDAVVLPAVSAESTAAAVMRSQSAGGNSTEPTAVVTRHRMQVCSTRTASTNSSSSVVCVCVCALGTMRQQQVLTLLR
jgi:hypothetical protein